MMFESLEALLTMQGHGVYVWTVFLVCFFSFGVFALVPVVKKRALFERIRKREQFALEEAECTQ